MSKDAALQVFAKRLLDRGVNRAPARDAVNDSGNGVEVDAGLLFNHHGQQLAANRVRLG